MASIKHHTKTEDTGISKVGRRRSNPGKRGPPPSPGVSRGIVGQGGGGGTKDDGEAVGAEESRDYYDGSADSKETHGNEDGGHDQSQEGKEDGEEEMMFDFGRKRRRERGEGGAGRKKKVGPLRRRGGGKNEILGRYAHIDDAKAFMRGVGLKSVEAFKKWSTTAARPVPPPTSRPWA